MNAHPLPIDAHLDAIVAGLVRHKSGVLVAEPGAGKTTRVPQALMGSLSRGQIWVLQPRRLAARLAAARVAASLGQKVGEHVGHRVRFDEAVGPHTRLIFMTEATLLRALLVDGRLPQVACVVMDEFHERGLSADLGLGALRQLQASTRPDLQLLVMSATLDATEVATFLATPMVISVPGRQYPIDIQHLPRQDPRPLPNQVMRATLGLLEAGTQGDILVFLPGLKTILQVARALRPAMAERGLDVVILHGSQPTAEQDRAVVRGPRPKVVLSTNVAQTSITLEDCGAVVDSGLARQAEHQLGGGIDRLSQRPISQAAATQRAGRAGRRRAGRCVRLWTRHDHHQRPIADSPAILRCDLS